MISYDYSIECLLVDQPVRKIAKAHEGAIIFTEANRVKAKCHNHSLYLEAVSNGVDFKCALVNNDASINKMPYDAFKRIGILKRRLVKQSLDMSGFGAVTLQTLGHISEDLKVSKIRGLTVFHVINAPAMYHILLGHPWIHENEVIP
ncbi:hypothetical protein CFOL_v3_18315 [Cephalotus follicularis]|uniref:Uncharacterized protein n=1 Tax=Cephalotus follicularis TaxID=3775 RepID=A0A1Q3C3L2_CEPFO|nr:hypothetical protein CFOL_v3_18315 [Cephalotus follicularis]